MAIPTRLSPNRATVGHRSGLVPTRAGYRCGVSPMTCGTGEKVAVGRGVGVGVAVGVLVEVIASGEGVGVGLTVDAAASRAKAGAPCTRMPAVIPPARTSTARSNTLIVVVG